MLVKRIIPCLDIKDGKVVKGTNFGNLRDAGDPVQLATYYSKQGADELVFLDISASHENRKTQTELVKEIAGNINIPFTTGGGISQIEDVDRLLNAGADKISINSTALSNPSIINQIASTYGVQVCVCAIDAQLEDGKWICYSSGGRRRTERELFEWAKEVQDRGAGEILFTSIDHDGMKNGYACETIAELSETLSIPIIASGGAGKMEHFKDVFIRGKADAALSASVFHFGSIEIQNLKEYLRIEGVSVR